VRRWRILLPAFGDLITQSRGPDDQLIVYRETFVIQGEPERRDPDRLVWTVDTRPA
jgi:hypothetical protein